ncbi:Fur family transcriptional regulator, ferric uptake regulator [Saccharicrinis carchari]|uniref:Fur family transcriptional regulator, ferric uptake regulator n=1 Tax=Saccharicrinis carchari TaxID=1168039 RepID=A0A521CLR8_SACCC|nr:transcriptional repressor [Saccharicrinis carchari]SMO60407.1 Fur family transcriptional regulator, ferric uptake regulator [Saccharicrinis carchari]
MKAVDSVPPKVFCEPHSYSAEVQRVSKMLREKGIRITQNRLQLLDVFIGARHPINQKEIEDRLREIPDRVTLYRNLRFFVKHNIIHKIEVNDSLTTYSLNRIHVDANHTSEHLHFYCNICNKVVCMPQYSIKKYDLPEGFRQQSSKLIVNGTCDVCNGIERK